MKKTLAIAALLVVVGVVQSNATEIIRELWDNVAPTNNGVLLKGLTNGTTSLGFYPSASVKWVINPADPVASNALTVAGWDIIQDWMKVYPILPQSVTEPATLALPQPNPNGWDSGTWATRMLASGSSINFSANGTYYFSAQIAKRSFYYPVNGTNGYGADDAAVGFGVASGSAATSHFVGIGLTRSVAGNLSGGGGYLTMGSSPIDIGDSAYITAGTLGQAGYTNHPADSGGPYYVRAYSGDGSGPNGAVNEVEGYFEGVDYVAGAFLVGQLTTTTSGQATMNVRAYVAGEVPDMSVDTVSWDASYTFTETANMNQLLVWMYGNNNFNPCCLDAIRVATTWAEVVGEEIVGPPTAVPTNVVYAGTPVTFSVFANLLDGSQSYQWLTNGVPDTNNGLGATYTLANTAVASSGSYSVAFSNDFDLVITSAVQTLTVLPSVPPYVVQQPGGLTRYASGSVTFSVMVNGAPPFTYQWEQVVGSTTNIVYGPTSPTTAFTNSFTITDVQAANAGSYIATITNAKGATNSQPAVLNVIVPTGFAAAVVANNPYAYWQMGETNGTVLHDYVAGNDGTVLDPSYTVTNIVATTNGATITYTTNITAAGVSLGEAGVVCAGFPANHYAVFMPDNGYLARVNMPVLPLYTNVMTFCGWIYTPSATGPNATGLILNRDLSSDGGYGNAYGLEFITYSTATATNNNMLGYQWGGGDINPNAAYLGYTWTNSGLYVPNMTWTFVALVLSNTQATIYMGTNNAPLTVASHTFPSAVDPNFPGASYPWYTNSYPLLIGRGGYPWAEIQGSAWNNVNVTMSDVAIFYSALPPTNVYKLYLAAVGELITTTTNASGNPVLSWPVGTLQAAGQVTGVYTNVPGATSPYTVPINAPQKFYRVLSQ